MDSIKDSNLDEKTQAIENAKRIIIDTTNTLSDREWERALNADESAYPKVYKTLDLKDKGLNIKVNAEMLGMTEEEKLVFKMVDSLFGFRQSLLSAKTDEALKTLAENLSISTKPLTEAINNIAGTLAVEFRFPDNIIIPNFKKVMPNNAFTDTINHLSEQLSNLNDQLKKTIEDSLGDIDTKQTIEDSLGDIEPKQDEDATPLLYPSTMPKFDGQIVVTSKPFNMMLEDGVVGGGLIGVRVFYERSTHRGIITELEIYSPNGLPYTRDDHLLTTAVHSLWRVKRGETIYPYDIAWMMLQLDKNGGVSRDRLDWITQTTDKLITFLVTLKATPEIQARTGDKTKRFEAMAEPLLPLRKVVSADDYGVIRVGWRFLGTGDDDAPVFLRHAEMTGQIARTYNKDYQIKGEDGKLLDASLRKSKLVNFLTTEFYRMVDPKTKKLKGIDKRTGRRMSRRILLTSILDAVDIDSKSTDAKSRMKKSRFIKEMLIPALNHLVCEEHKQWTEHYVLNRGFRKALVSVDIYFQGEAEEISAKEAEKSQNEGAKDA